MWNKITLYKFQQVDRINSQKDMDELDKLLFSVCTVFDYTEFQLDNLGVEKVGRLTTRLTKIFNSPFKPKPYNRVGRYRVNYDVSKVTLGQYIELSFFLSENPIQNAHYVMASVTNRKADHRRKAEYFLKRPIIKIMGGLSLIIERFIAFNKEYSGLFGLDREVNGDAQSDYFNRRYGWIYSASQLAEYERISLDQAMNLPIRQAFNDLAYLKALAKYQAEQLKQQ